MKLSVWLDVAIGLAVVYVGASLVATVVNEYLAQLFKKRGKQLLDSLWRLVQDPELRAELRKVPAFATLFPPPVKAGKAGALPSWGWAAKSAALSYVDPALLARAIVTVLSPDGTGLAGLAEKVAASSPLRLVLRDAAAAASADRARLVAELGTWIDQSLNALGETYKRHLQGISLLVGLALAGVLNLDTVALVDSLYRDRAVRDAMVALGEVAAKSTTPEDFQACLAGASDGGVEPSGAGCGAATQLAALVRTGATDAVALPIGWAGPHGRMRPGPGEDGLTLWVFRVLGWLLTAFAVSLGAPFWFDLLSRFVNLRHAMRKPGAEPAGDKRRDD